MKERDEHEDLRFQGEYELFSFNHADMNEFDKIHSFHILNQRRRRNRFRFRIFLHQVIYYFLKVFLLQKRGVGEKRRGATLRNTLIRTNIEHER